MIKGNIVDDMIKGNVYGGLDEDKVPQGERWKRTR
jgi:hypothetical protein